jgi:GT2 family glycosyltransferase
MHTVSGKILLTPILRSFGAIPGLQRTPWRPERDEALSTKPLGIVIPTHNRAAALLECLGRLEKQSFKSFEVVVVDDGSTDATAELMQTYLEGSPLCIRYVRQDNSGPAKARNLGISMLEAPICLLLGDDIFASPMLVQRHLEAHQENDDRRMAALGFTRWNDAGQIVTPFMRWLDEANVQFAYPLLLSGVKPDWRHFYSSNLSLKTDLLRQFAFNERFPYAAMEDIELAYRIGKTVGLDLQFLPDAVADHLHPTTFRQACKRMIRAGYSAGLFYDLWPEQRPPQPRGMRQRIVHRIARSRALLKLATAAVALITQAACPNPFIPYVLYAYFEIGLDSQLRTKAGMVAA